MPSTPALAHAPLTHQTNRAPTHAYALLHVFDSRATHARTLLPAALASVPFGFVLVRVRVRNIDKEAWVVANKEQQLLDMI